MKPEEYLVRVCHSLKNPRLKEEPAIYRQFQKLAHYILGGDFDEPIFVLDCYTTEVYPRYVQCSDCNFMAWVIIFGIYMEDFYLCILHILMLGVSCRKNFL